MASGMHNLLLGAALLDATHPGSDWTASGEAAACLLCPEALRKFCLPDPAAPAATFFDPVAMGAVGADDGAALDDNVAPRRCSTRIFEASEIACARDPVEQDGEEGVLGSAGCGSKMVV